MLSEPDQEGSMRDYITQKVLVILGAMIVLVAISLPAKAQSSTSLYISLNPTTVLAGEWSRVSAVVINESTAKVRVTVTFVAVDPCGTQTTLGYNRLALAAGEQVLITTAYPTKVDSCRGTHAVTISTGGKGGTPGTSATAYLQVN
jgi:hypothetical protein